MRDDAAVCPPFDGIPRDAGGHFKLWFYTAALRVLAGAVRRFASWDALFERFPFLAHYNNELARAGLGGRHTGDAAAWWTSSLLAWEETVDVHLPLRALQRAAALDRDAIALFCAIGLVEEDPRFGLLFDALQNGAGQKRPSLGLLATWWAEEAEAVRGHARRLQDLGLAQLLGADGPRSEWMLAIPPAVWDAARGEQHREVASGLTFVPSERLLELDALVAGPSLRSAIAALPPLIESGDCGAVVLRGPHHNGRRAIAGALARSLGRGLLEAAVVGPGAEERWRALGPLATMLHAVPFVRVDLPPGETIRLEPLYACDAPLVVAAGRHGGVGGAAIDSAVTVSVDRPGAAERARHWTAALAEHRAVDLPAIAERFRLTSGNIARAARLACVRAKSERRAAIRAEDVREAARTLSREALETLATWMPPTVDWRHVSVPPHVRRDLDDLERRCRQRERLGDTVGPALASQLTSKTVAMLTGPSGVGKSICARALAASLQLDLYQLNVSAILDKFVGEAEKRLYQLFTRAEELDVVLLLDEGDGLMARRTAVSSSTDRYANAETSFLLTAIESFDSILLITTNAADRVDPAFLRRMDVVIEFPLPDAAERFAIWRMHLPAAHVVDEGTLAEIAAACAITGGQIKNAVLHACSLALDGGGPPSAAHVWAGVEREYRKAGMVCPLSKPAGAVAYAG